MKTIVQLVQEKTGISVEQAQEAVDTVAAYLKANLPEPVAGQVDTLLKSDVSGVMQQAKGLLGSLGGMFGDKKDK
jgi:hypothetical protein